MGNQIMADRPAGIRPTSWSPRKALTTAALSMALAGVVLYFSPFVLSLRPSARADAALPRVDISNIRPGTFQLVTPTKSFEYFNGFKRSVYFLRTGNGDLQAWEVYAKNGEVGMPDYHWWSPYYLCKEFGPDMRDGAIDENSLIRCRDKDLSPGQADYWTWRINGKAVAQSVDDMRPAPGVVEGKYFVLGKTR